MAEAPPDHGETLIGGSAKPVGDPQPQGAVFISYCSRDAPAAERICEALRTIGINVWLDKNELRGGDAWDAQIRSEFTNARCSFP